jgi:hypothetical protein
METPKDQDVISGSTESPTERAVVTAKEPWVKPEIVDFKPVAVARGLSMNIGDGFSNLS